jgi:hypothetical protein
MRMGRPHVCAGLLLAGADGAAIGALRRAPGRLASGLASPHHWLADVGADAALATLAATGLCFAAIWLAAGLLAAAVAALPGSTGRIAARLARTLLPRVLYRLVAGTAGLGVALAPVSALAQPTPGGPTPARGGLSRPVPAPTWPVDGGPIGREDTAGSAVPTPRWPTEPGSTEPVRSPRAAVPEPSRPSRPADDRAVTVRAGDSLWLIAGRRLGAGVTPAEIAAAWPRWYAANRAVIGDDPALIVAGQVLHAPTHHSKEAPA